jgi:hypothetical protein
MARINSLSASRPPDPANRGSPDCRAEREWREFPARYRDAGKEYLLSTYDGPDSAPNWDCGSSIVSFTSTRDGNPNVFEVGWQGGDQSNVTTDPSTDKWSEGSPSKEEGSRGH